MGLALGGDCIIATELTPITLEPNLLRLNLLAFTLLLDKLGCL